MDTLQGIVRELIDALSANVAVLDGAARIIAVNHSWRRFGQQRGAASDYLGMNYLDVCAGAADLGDRSAARVVAGLRRLLCDDIDHFGLSYPCGERVFRLRARSLDHPAGRLIIVAHEDITALLRAHETRRQVQLKVAEVRQEHADRVAVIHEELGQRLAAISLAAQALEAGGDPTTSAAFIHLAVDEARREVRLLRYAAERDLGGPLP